MLSNAQKGLLKRAQAEAGLDDADYRLALATVSGFADCHSSTDPRLADAHLDSLLSYFEAIHWQSVYAGLLSPSKGRNPVFRARGFWATRNRRGNTSRDRYTETDLTVHIRAAEADLAALGFNAGYCHAIRRNIPSGDDWKYLAALNRTLKSKQAKVEQPF